MRSRVVWILLALSLALNVSFVAGFVHTRSALRGLQTREGRTRWIADRLKLEGERRKQFEQLAEEWRSQMRARQDESRAATEAFWAEMLRDRRDREKIRKMVERSFPAQGEALLWSADHLIRVFDVLSPDERRALATMIQDRTRF